MNRLYTRKGFSIVIIFVDLVIIYLSIFLAYFIFEDTLEAYEDNFYAFLSISPYIGLCYLIINQIFDLDKPKDFTFFGVAYPVTLSIISLLLLTMAISFLTRKFAYPRSILIVSSLMQILLLTLWHLFVNKNFLKENVRNTVLIIGFDKAKELAYKLLRSKGAWSKVRKICSPDDAEVLNYIKENNVVFLAEDVDENTKQNIVELCVTHDKPVLYEPKNPEILLFNASFTQIGDTPVLRVKPLVLGSGNSFLKRALDIFLSLIALIIFAIPIFIISIALRAGGGSIFYRQKRVTRYGKTFWIFKFRTMIENAEALSGPVLSQEKDTRITKLGHILRATRMDEIPQIFNILKGEMSIVGPRPERPFFVEQFKKEIPEYDLRHRVKAGLTGLAQIQGKYNTDVKDKLKYDLLYINGYSFALDIKLIMQTLNILLRKSSTEGIKEDVDFEEEIRKMSQDDNKEPEKEVRNE